MAKAVALFRSIQTRYGDTSMPSFEQEEFMGGIDMKQYQTEMRRLIRERRKEKPCYSRR